MDFARRRNRHGRRERVVGRLAAIDVVVGMDGVFAAELASGEFNRAVGDDLIGVHIALRARAGLPDDKRKMIVKFAINDLKRCLFDQFSGVGFNKPLRHIHTHGGEFDDAECMHHRDRNFFAANVKIFETALSCAPQYLSLGTSISLIESASLRVLISFYERHPS